MILTVENYVSINLNFVIFANNLYETHYDYNSNRFPWVFSEENNFLDVDVFKQIIEEKWNLIIEDLNLVKNDIDYWKSDYFCLKELFFNDSSQKFYNMVKKTFEHWFWGTGYHLCSLYSDNLVEYYYSELTNLEKGNESLQIDKHIYLQTIYDYTPDNWKLFSKNIIVVCPESPLPEVSHVYELINLQEI